MYGIGYGYAGNGGIGNPGGVGSSIWGMYVASAGVARIFLDSDNGRGHFTSYVVASNITSAGDVTGSSASCTGNAATATDASTLNSISAVNLFNNMGQTHGTRSSFDASTPSYNFGFRYVQGNGNGPATGGGSQFYSWYQGLGSDYAATGAGSYGMYIAIPRGATTPYMSVRYNEGNSLGAWIKIAAGFADSATTAGSCSGNSATATTATNQSGGTVSATTGTFSGNVTVSSGNVTGGGIILADDGDIVDLNDGYCTMRFSAGVRVFSANRGGSAVITLANSGNVTAASFSGSLTGNVTGNVSGSSGSCTGNAATATTAGALTTGNNYQVNSFGVGTAASGTAGEIRATNNVTAYYSDERLKENITTISSALSKLLTLRGVTFNSNKIAEQYGYTDKKEQVGVIAQDVEKVLPQVVVPAPFDIAQDEDGNEYSKSGENYKTVHYDKLVPLLIEAIKEQQEIIVDLQNRLEIIEGK
jgi:hypothetical protein